MGEPTVEEVKALLEEATLLFLQRAIAFLDHAAGDGLSMLLPDGTWLGADEIIFDYLEATGGLASGQSEIAEIDERLRTHHPFARRILGLEAEVARLTDENNALREEVMCLSFEGPYPERPPRAPYSVKDSGCIIDADGQLVAVINASISVPGLRAALRDGLQDGVG